MAWGKRPRVFSLHKFYWWWDIAGKWLFSPEALREYPDSKPDKVNMKRRLEAYASFTEEFGKEDKRPLCPVCEEMCDIDVYK